MARRAVGHHVIPREREQAERDEAGDGQCAQPDVRRVQEGEPEEGRGERLAGEQERQRDDGSHTVAVKSIAQRVASPGEANIAGTPTSFTASTDSSRDWSPNRPVSRPR